MWYCNRMIRRANHGDSSLLLEWRNEAETRAMGHNTAPVKPDEHAEWFDRSLKSDKRLLYIYEADKTAVAVVRFDLEDDAAKVSLTVAPSQRGKNLATPAMDAGLAAMALEWPHVRYVVAYIKPDNVRSIRMCERSGFRHVHTEGDLSTYHVTFR